MATDFFDRQNVARKQTGLLVGYFALAVLAIISAVYVTITLLIVFADKKPVAEVGWLDWERLGIVSAFVGLIILSGSLYKIAVLREGGESVARLLGGRAIDPNTLDLHERKLLNVVEEMAIASGTPVPTVFVLDEEDGINAFAAGTEPGDAAIAVSRGGLLHLSRDELQGVIGHEFSHILNGDMRLNLKLIGVLHGILLLALIGQLLVRSTSSGTNRSSRDDKKDGSAAMALLLLGLALIAIGFIGVFFGRLIKSAISRQREFLADASAVQFTRNPAGIAGALKKIGGLAEGSRIHNVNAEQACHMFFGQGVPMLTDLLATHPPLAVRIQRLDPSFDGTFPTVEPLDEVDDRAEAASGHAVAGATPSTDEVITMELDEPAPPPSGDSGTTRRGSVEKEKSVAIDPAALVASVGTPSARHVAYASALLDGLPPALLTAAREPAGARALVYALLLDFDPKVRPVQLQWLDANAEPGTTEAVLKLVPLVASVGPETYIPLVDVCLPALRRLSARQYRIFRASIEPLIMADRRVSFFEFALQRLLVRHLDQHFRTAPAQPARSGSPKQLGADIAVLLSTLAHFGNDGPDAAARAFAQGAARLGDAGAPAGLLARSDCSLDRVNEALNNLVGAPPNQKLRALDACAACVAADGQVTVTEGELLRAFADSLNCPMPPLLATASTPPQPAGTRHTSSRF